MNKTIQIALKDLLIAFRDPTGLVLMLAAPLLLTLVVGFAFGGIGGGSSTNAGLKDIPVVLVNHDTGQFSGFIVQAFKSEELADLLETSVLEDEAAARQQVEQNQVAAAVIIPENFSDSILPDALLLGDMEALKNRPKSVVEVYASPDRPLSASVVRSIIDTILGRIVAGATGGQVAVEQLIENKLITAQQAGSVGRTIGQQAVIQAINRQYIGLQRQVAGKAAEGGFDWLKYIAPSMAVFYLMFTMTNAARSILQEKEAGTLPRLMTSPTSRASVLGGKMLGTFLTGLVQMLVLIAAGGLIFRLDWGQPLAVFLVTVAVVAAATGWGLVEAALAKTPGQANAIGTAVNLVFAALGGTFIPRAAYPDFLRFLGNITPNAWGSETYYGLMYGKSLVEVAPALLVLFGMAAVLFVAASLIFKRRYA